jgi:hypothetical protein
MDVKEVFNPNARRMDLLGAQNDGRKDSDRRAGILLPAGIALPQGAGQRKDEPWIK